MIEFCSWKGERCTPKVSDLQALRGFSSRSRECSRSSTRRRVGRSFSPATRPPSSAAGSSSPSTSCSASCAKARRSVTELFRRFHVRPDDVRREIEGERVFVERISSTAELPLSEESKKILAYAAHEAESMLHPDVGIGAPADRHPARRRLRRGAHPHRSRASTSTPLREEVLAIAKEREASLAEEGAAVPLRVQPRPHRARHPGQLRPAHRPRAGGRADHPDPVAAHQEQPDPAR